MNRPGRWKIAVIGGVVLATVLATAAVVGAQTPVPGTSVTGTTFLSRVAAKLGIDTSTLENAVKTTQEEDIDARVASGELTQAQADALKQRIANAPAGAPIFGGGFGDHGPGMGRGAFADPEQMATFLGITADQFRTEISADGATLATVAAAHGKSRDDLKAFITSEMKTRLDQEVAEGDLTQAQADARLADLTQNLDQMIDSAGHFGGGFGPGGPMTVPSSSTPSGTNNG